MRVTETCVVSKSIVGICGLSAGGGGAADFVDEVELGGLKVLRPSRHFPLGSHLRERRLLRFIIQGGSYLFVYLMFTLKLVTLRRQDIIIFHPQTIGLLATCYLLIFHRRISIFVLDNFIVCRRSYNYHPLAGGECLRCAEGKRAFRDCKARPGYRFAALYNLFSYVVRKKLYKLNFYFQNQRSRDLHEQCLGPVSGSVVGLSMPTFRSNPVRRRGTKRQIVFHGSLIPEKGLLKFLDLAAALPEFQFLIPGQLDLNVPPNVLCRPMNWTSGLREEVEESCAVFCGSQWSAPIEAAFIKSVVHNGVVILQRTAYGLTSELPQDVFLTLDASTELNKDNVDSIKAGISDFDLSAALAQSSLEIFDQLNLRMKPSEYCNFLLASSPATLANNN